MIVKAEAMCAGVDARAPFRGSARAEVCSLIEPSAQHTMAMELCVVGAITPLTLCMFDEAHPLSSKSMLELS